MIRVNIVNKTNKIPKIEETQTTVTFFGIPIFRRIRKAEPAYKPSEARAMAAAFDAGSKAGNKVDIVEPGQIRLAPPQPNVKTEKLERRM